MDRDGWILKSADPVVQHASFDRSVLLVNGVDWASYGTEITSAYTDRAFWGTYGVDFWDVLAAPAAGYPAILPAPLGHDAVPGDVLGHYRNVIWVGNNFAGDLYGWQASPILSYLRAGGNVLLLSRLGDVFLADSLRSYLGVNWTATGTALPDATPTRPGLAGMTRLSTQSLCALFDTMVTTPETQLLLRTSPGYTPASGIGAVRVPAGGAGRRPRGGRLAFVSGRPYRWNHADLAANVMSILANWFLEPANLASAQGVAPRVRLALGPARPNPSNGAATLHFSLPRAAHARLLVLDVAGRRVCTLLDASLASGPHEAAWDGRDEGGAVTAAGLYWAKLEAAGEVVSRRLVRVR